MSFEMRKILKSKRTMRRHLAALPLAEKFRLLDKLRERSVAIAASRARRLVHQDSHRGLDLK